MKNLIPIAGLHPYRSPWISRLSGPHAFAFVVLLGISIPFIMGGVISFIFWFLGYLLFQPMFWASLGALVIAAILAG